VPLALRAASPIGPRPPPRCLRGNLLIYGVGGIIAPFAGIKLIDLLLVLLQLD